jgi:hypothetical protein
MILGWMEFQEQGTRRRGRTVYHSPRRANYLAQDPFTHAATMDLAVLQISNLYIDAGTTDEFQFNIHAENFVDMVNSVASF